MQGSQASTYHQRRVALDQLHPSIPARYYFDPQHYERELEVFWYGMWVMAGREEEIPAPRDYRVVKIGTQSIVIVRDLEGRLQAFHNTCRHRGSILCTEEQGRLPGRSLVCPYHTWTYSLDGELIGTPRQMESPDFDKAAYPLFKVAVGTWGGFIFVNLAGDRATPLHEALGDLPERFRNYGFADLRIGKRIVMDVKANWKLLFENFSECFHCPPVHPELCDIATLFWDAGAWGLRTDAAGNPLASARPRYKAGAATLTMDGSARIPPFKGLSAEERVNLYQSATFRPNFFLNVHPDYVNSHQMLATGPESVRMIYDWLFEPDNMPRSEADLEHYVALWDLTNRQDARNCEWQQEGLHARPLAHGNFVPQEHGCHQFNQWVLESLGERERQPGGSGNGGGMSGMA